MKTTAAGKQHHADILILGAGPSGCAAAISARLAGMSAVLLEARSPATHIPGETLHPGLEPVLKSLGVWEPLLRQQFHRHRGIWREEKDGQRRFEAYGSDASGPWLGFQVDRARLGTILQTRVAELGGRIIRVGKLNAVGRKNFSVSGITADGALYNSLFVLDATGRHAWLADRLGLVPEVISPSQRLRFGWIKANPPELDSQPLFQQTKDGWDWISPLGDGRCAWVKMRRSSTYRGLDYAWRIFRDCAGPGYFLLGDAACLMDPSAANGVLRALMSGIYAVHLISAGGRGMATRSHAANEYRRWIADLFDQTRKELNARAVPYPKVEAF